MVLPTSKKNVGLGKAMIRSRFRNGSRPKDHDTDLVHTTDMDDGPSWTKLQSITQEGDLDSFLRIAELADTDFTAHRQNVTVVSAEDNNPFLMSKDEESRIQQLHKTFQNEVVIPRRPHWDKSMTARQVQRNEQTAFLDWRRSLALLQESNGILLTPYERNLEVWRQLWRVVERSQLVIQIVDARNPMIFRSEDLEKYVSEVHGGHVDCLLLVNKADLLTDYQRTQWADYFDKNNIKYKFFSAKISNVELERELEREMNELKLSEQKDEDQSDDEESDNEESENEESDNEEDYEPEPATPQNKDDDFYPSAFGKTSSKDPRIQILSCTELLDLFHTTAKPSENPDIPEQYRNKITIGLVGYPNVGKSSTINALIGSKKVAVASTPGKTKHFQTLHLDEKTILCDCPGLVFPSFATTQANMVCDGVLSIDQLREYTGPIGLVVRRIPKWYLEALYGIHISMPTVQEGGDGTNIPLPEDFLKSYAMARGYTKAGQGNPDEARGARYILKDYVNAKLLYNHPPPGCEDVEAFNKEIYSVENLPKKKLFTAAEPTNQKKILGTNTNLLASKALDGQFFTNQKILSAHAISKGKYQTSKFGRNTVYPHQRMANADGTISLDSSSPQSEFMVKDKKHRKGKKNVKSHSRMGYDV